MWCISDIRPRPKAEDRYHLCIRLSVVRLIDITSLTFISCFSIFYCYERVLLQCFTWCLLLYECWTFYDWLRVLTSECTLKFHKLQRVEYPYRTSSVTECPPFNFECPLQSTKQIRRVQWQTDRLPATPTSCYTQHLCSQPSGEREDHTVFLLIFGNQINYESLTAEQTLSFGD